MAVAHSRSRGFFGTRYVMFAREKCRCDSEWLCLTRYLISFFLGKVKSWVLPNFFKSLGFGSCVDLKGAGGSVAPSVTVSANRGWVCASLLPPRLGLTSQPPTGTRETPPLCTTSTPWGQTSTCRLSGLSARSSRTTTRKHCSLLPPPLFRRRLPGFPRGCWGVCALISHLPSQG